MDFPTAAQQLADAGFVANPGAWTDPPEADLNARLAALATSYDSELTYRDLR